MPLNLKIFDHLNEEPEKLFRLYGKVYGDSSTIRIRWNWEFIQHPMSEKFKFFIAESETGDLGGMGMPAELNLEAGDGRHVLREVLCRNVPRQLVRGWAESLLDAKCLKEQCCWKDRNTAGCGMRP